MGLFFRKEDKKEGTGGGRSFAKSYDKEKTKPAIRCSICNGEQVAGFLNKRSGQFEEIALLAVSAMESRWRDFSISGQGNSRRSPFCAPPKTWKISRKLTGSQGT